MSATAVQIRVAGQADAEAISRIHRRARQVAYEGLVSPEKLAAMQAWVTPQNWVELMRKSAAGSRMLVAEQEGVVIGFIFVVPKPDEELDSEAEPSREAETSREGRAGVGDVVALHVDPDHQGGGIGTMLLRAGLEFLAGQGYSSYVLWVLEGNERAMRFYRKHGWRHDGQRIDEGGVDFLRFVYVEAG